jgi:polysaccharide biosynthesis/export protein
MSALSRREGIFVAVMLVCGFFSACAAGQVSATQATTSSSPPVTEVANPSAVSSETASQAASRLGPGDLLEITVYNVPELTTKVRINVGGDVHLPLINYVHLAGLTNEEAEALIEKRLSDGGFVKNPQVTVSTDQSLSQTVSILGEVAKPGIYPILPEQRLFDVISAAGGLTEKAGRSLSVTHREQSDTHVTILISRNLMDNPQSNIALLAGDTIVVRRADVVYVVGDVGRPSGFLMDSGKLTVLQAIALAGGTSKTANLGGTRIIRKGPNGMEETPVQLKKILRAKAPDLPMQAEDILFVPTSAVKGFAGHTLSAAIQAASAASIIAVVP